MRDAQDADVLAAGPSPAPTGAGMAENPGAGRLSRPLRRAVAVAAGVVAVDQLTKWWAVERLSTGSCANPETCIELLAGIRLRLVFNTGAAFTTGAGYGPALAVLAMVMTVVLLAMSARRPDRPGAVLLAMIAGGAVGNLIDRVFRAGDGLFSGAVIDFIDLGWWPVFNLADSAIVVGVVAMVVSTFFEDRSADAHRSSSGGGSPEAGGADHDGADPDPVPGDPVG